MENFQKNSRSSKKIEKRALLVLPGIVCYAEKKENLIYLNSQVVQFGAFNFVELEELFWPVRVDVWIEKSHYYRRVFTS